LRAALPAAIDRPTRYEAALDTEAMARPLLPTVVVLILGAMFLVLAFRYRSPLLGSDVSANDVSPDALLQIGL